MSRRIARKRLTALAAALGLGVLQPGGALAADSMEIQAGVLGGLNSSMRSVGFEMPLERGKSWTARGGSVSCVYTPRAHTLDLFYSEDGSGSFLGAGFRLYRGAESKGWYFGVNLDYVSISVDRTWSYAFSDEHEHVDIVGFVPGLSGGYKAVFDNGFTVETSLYTGWLSAAGTGDLEVTEIGGFGIALGKRF